MSTENTSKVTLSVQIPVEMKHKLDAQAEAEGRDLSKHTRFILQKHLRTVEVPINTGYSIPAELPTGKAA